VLTRWLFLRLLGLVYLAAFLSLWVQVRGLIGSGGIQPVGQFLEAVREYAPGRRFLLAPTLCWLAPSDVFLDVLCGLGTLLSVVLITGLAPLPVLFLLWATYLSLTVAGQIFLGYQWDGLLLETGILAVLVAPGGLRPRLSQENPPSRLTIWLLRWLLFRLMFGSGIVKLLSGDATWRDLTALQYHYATQPLPTWTSWYMHQLPGWFQSMSVLVTFLIELVLPVLILGPRRARLVACAGIVLLQLLIAATGNYGFFNLLTIVLCVPLLDDAVFPARWRGRAADVPQKPSSGILSWLRCSVAMVLLLLSFLPFLQNLPLTAAWDRPVSRVYGWVAPFRSVNSYGLFAVMTTRRAEIIVEGSNDAKVWKRYTFGWKPGDPQRRPPFTGLHLPRLDWQMWFAALGPYRRSPWFYHFLHRLLDGSPEVLALLEENPFPDRPPRYVRALLYEYHFTDFAERRETGAWWRRELLGLYCPVISLKAEPSSGNEDPLP
jgi:hypothetical protein